MEFQSIFAWKALPEAAFVGDVQHNESKLEIMTTVFRFLGSISLLSALILAGCGNSASSVQASRGSGAIERPRDAAAVPVTVAQVERRTIPVQLHAIGAGQAFKTVSVESQVAGIVK